MLISPGCTPFAHQLDCSLLLDTTWVPVLPGLLAVQLSPATAGHVHICAKICRLAFDSMI